MNKKFSIGSSILLLILLALALAGGCGEREEPGQLSRTAAYVMAAVPQPVCASVGGEWAVIGLARCGYPLDEEYFDGYYARLCQTLEQREGILDARKNSEYSRAILALTAMGRNPADVAGYDLLLPLADYEQTLLQGINGPIWALIALDCGNYELPQSSSGLQASRELYVQAILDAQGEQGGWALTPGAGDVDLTAMAIQALAKYESRDDAGQAIQQALAWLSQQQRPNGGFFSYGEENSESVAQVIVALGELGLSLDDSRFVKNGFTLADALLRFACADGGFCHTLGSGADLMATEQSLYALAALARRDSGQSSLYRMAE